jgi:hypothetical protein
LHTGEKLTIQYLVQAHQLSQAGLRMSHSDETVLKVVEEVTDIINLYELLRPTYYSEPRNDFTETLYDKTSVLFRNILAFQASAAKFLSKNTAERSVEAFVGWNDWDSRRNTILENVQDCHNIRDALRDARGQTNQQNFEAKWQNFEVMIQQIRGDTKYLRAIEEKEAEFAREEKILAWLSDEKIESNLHSTLHKSGDGPMKQPDEIPKGYELPDDWFRDTAQTWLQDKTADNVFWLHGRREHPFTVVGESTVLI